MVNTERVLAGGEALAFVAKYGKLPSAVGAAAAWLLRQPDGAVPNGRWSTRKWSVSNSDS